MTVLERSAPPKKRGEPRKNRVNLERGRADSRNRFLLHISGLIPYSNSVCIRVKIPLDCSSTIRFTTLDPSLNIPFN